MEMADFTRENQLWPTNRRRLMQAESIPGSRCARSGMDMRKAWIQLLQQFHVYSKGYAGTPARAVGKNKAAGCTGRGTFCNLGSRNLIIN